MNTQADPASQASAPDLAALMAKAAANDAASKESGGGGPKFEEVTKDMKSQEGLFTLWFYPAEAEDKDMERLLAQIPRGLLGEDFMLSLSFSGGGFFTGFPLEERVVRWELHNKQLLLIEPETRFITEGEHTVADVVRRTYPDRIRVAVPIITKSKGGDPLIDLGPMLKSNFADIAWMGGAGINATLSRWTKRKTFPLNVEIATELAIRRASPPGSHDRRTVHYSFWKLPASDYKPRIADDRVGYFLTTHQDWSKPIEARDLFNRYIDRWHLVKRDPKLPLCEPRQPIIFYIEKTVPVRYRRAVRDGILEWNRAFEKIGFVNAIEVRQQTDDNEWKDLDPEDMRYSFIRWIVTGGGFAMGPHRSNPFTGQIYDADIVFDDSMVRSFVEQAGQLLPAAATATVMRDAAMERFLEAHPQWQRHQPDWETLVLGEDRSREAEVRETMRERLHARGYFGCDYAEGMKHEMAVARALLTGQPQEVVERFLYDTIKETVTHEVGHTLGLRHNFASSSVYTLEEIKARRTTGEALVGSIMDYNPILLFNEEEPEGHFITPTIGPYDYWAIEYGYRPADGSYKPETPDEDKQAKAEEEGEEEQPEKPEDPLKKVSKETLDRLPPEVKELLESDEAKQMLAAKAAEKETEEEADAEAPAGPTFTGPGAAERKMLHEIASRAGEPELVYASDVDTTVLGPDPRSNRFDMGKDPVEWAQMRIDLIDRRMGNILEWAVKDGESWYHLRQAFTTLLFEKARVLGYVGRYIGGQYTTRAHRGDDNTQPPFVLVDPDRQRKALEYLEQTIFTDEFFAVEPGLLNHLAAPRWVHTGANINLMVDFPIHRIIGVLQWMNLMDRLFPNTLRRIHDAEVKTEAADKLTVAEYLQRVQKACWGVSLDAKRIAEGTWTDTEPLIPSVRRSLQREYLSLMEPLARIAPGIVLSPDLHAMVQQCLRQLAEGIDNVLSDAATAGKLDFASKGHLNACKSRIERLLEPELEEYGL
jgi:hypothetical protein